MHGDFYAKTLESHSAATDPTEELDKANLIPARPSALTQVGEGGRDGTWVQLLAPAHSSASLRGVAGSDHGRELRS